jgi:hypothetical protein
LLLYIFWKGPKQATSRGCNICDVCAGRINKIIFCYLAQSTINLQFAFRKTGIYPVDRNVISFSMLPAEVFQSSITNEGDNINSVNSHVVIHIDESGDACLNASICTSSGTGNIKRL